MYAIIFKFVIFKRLKVSNDNESNIKMTTAVAATTTVSTTTTTTKIAMY